jgi:hypothetical protein
MQGFVAAPTWIGVDLARKTGLFAKALNEGGAAIADDDNSSTRLFNPWLFTLQLHRLLMAENSAEVSNQREHDRFALPQLFE